MIINIIIIYYYNISIIIIIISSSTISTCSRILQIKLLTSIHSQNTWHGDGVWKWTWKCNKSKWHSVWQPCHSSKSQCSWSALWRPWYSTEQALVFFTLTICLQLVIHAMWVPSCMREQKITSSSGCTKEESQAKKKRPNLIYFVFHSRSTTASNKMTEKP